jgi:hypothetical protein
MKFLFVLAIGVFAIFSSVPAHALQDGRQLYSDCTRGNPFSEGYCEGFIVGVLSAHLSPWVINLQKGRSYICIPGNVTFKEMAEIVQRYLAEHPYRHRYWADINIWTAATEAFPCSSE